MKERLARPAVLALGVLAVTALHRTLPTDSHAAHVWHLFAERLYYLPILLAAAWLSVPATAAITLLASVAYVAHIWLDWKAQPMIQAEQAANLLTFWLVGMTASLLFRRWKGALKEVASAHEETLTALAASLELREPYTAGHSARVRDYTLRLAQDLGLDDPEDLRRIAQGAFFHDIGKIGLPDAVVLKKGSLTPEEERVMRRHPELGAELVGRVGFLRAARELVLNHQERFDGQGYPHGAKGEDIPLGARLFAVADAFDAMTTDRPYRAGLPYDEAAERIRAERGRQFDPAVVDAFLSVDFEDWRRMASEHGVQLRRSGGTTLPMA